MSANLEDFVNPVWFSKLQESQELVLVFTALAVAGLTYLIYNVGFTLLG